MEAELDNWLSVCGPWTLIISTTQEHFRNAYSFAHSRPTESKTRMAPRNLFLKALLGVFVQTQIFQPLRLTYGTKSSSPLGLSLVHMTLYLALELPCSLAKAHMNFVQTTLCI